MVSASPPRVGRQASLLRLTGIADGLHHRHAADRGSRAYTIWFVPVLADEPNSIVVADRITCAFTTMRHAPLSHAMSSNNRASARLCPLPCPERSIATRRMHAVPSPNRSMRAGGADDASPNHRCRDRGAEDRSDRAKRSVGCAHPATTASASTSRAGERPISEEFGRLYAPNSAACWAIHGLAKLIPGRLHCPAFGQGLGAVPAARGGGTRRGAGAAPTI